MTIETNIRDILELMGHPAFCVCNRAVSEVNASAEALGICPGMTVDSLIHSGAEEYHEFLDGILFLSLQIQGQKHSARISKLDSFDLFALEREYDEPRLQAFALAAQELRKPLSQTMISCDKLMEALEDSVSEEAAGQFCRMNRGLYQLMRLVSNMSDAQTAGIARMETRDLTSLMQEIMDHAQPLCSSAGITLRFANHPVSVFSLVDSQKLERAVYNLLSNAMKHTPSGGELDVQFARRGNAVALTVTNPGNGAQGQLSANAFEKFLREPGTGSLQDGLGLGMTLIRAVADAHQGTLLFKPVSNGMQAVLRLPIRQDRSTLRSPSLRVDYAGERDHGLIELSDLLPPELYSSK